MRNRRILLATLLALVVGCSGAPTKPDLARPLATPAAPGSGEPNLTVGADGRLYLSWIESADEGHALRFATWKGQAWSAARTIATGDDWFVNWADFPSLDATAGGTLAAHWLQRSGSSTYAYDVRLSVSRDDGESWIEPFSPHDDGTQTEHGFVSIVPLAGDRFEILWLDGRETAVDAKGIPLGTGVMTLRSATLDADGHVGETRLIDKRVCDCCSTDAVPVAETVLAVFRDRSEGDIRDISTATLDPGGWTPVRPLHDDGWKISACPVNGPALAVSGDQVAAAWFTAPLQKGTVNVAFSADGGKTFGDPWRVDAGKPVGRVDVVMLDDGTAVVSWLEQGAIRLRWVDESGPRSEPLVAATADESKAGGFPRLARLRDELFLAWTEPGEVSRVRTATVPAIR